MVSSLRPPRELSLPSMLGTSSRWLMFREPFKRSGNRGLSPSFPPSSPAHGRRDPLSSQVQEETASAVGPTSRYLAPEIVAEQDVLLLAAFAITGRENDFRLPVTIVVTGVSPPPPPPHPPSYARSPHHTPLPSPQARHALPIHLQHAP